VTLVPQQGQANRGQRMVHDMYVHAAKPASPRPFSR
jgi:hypothetical protein